MYECLASDPPISLWISRQSFQIAPLISLIILPLPHHLILGKPPSLLMTPFILPLKQYHQIRVIAMLP